MGNKLKYTIFLFLLLFTSFQSIYSAEGGKSKEMIFDLEEDDDFFEEDEEEVKISDPLKWFNRPIFKLNDKLYSWILRPTGKAYKKVVPKFVRGRFRDFFTNLKSPLRIVGNGLQGDVRQSIRETGSFIINSTIGLGGLFDPAGRQLKIVKKNEDFGQVFGKWGIKSGPYLQLPFMGPSNLRDTFASVIDGLFSPINYFFPHNSEGVIGLRALSIVDSTSRMIDRLDQVKRDSIDPYSFSRDAWMQLRERQVKN
jgi:phospholipid-binding lipoprotein MlaA